MAEGAVKTYRLYHRIQKVSNDVEAESAQEACQKVGWYIADVWVRERTPVVADLTSESGHRGGGWKNVTPGEVRP
uniref:Uncharacterized protein n=1 Tax=viral metagenome TaxID=1070528 RepID=A0A6M3XYH8_9ZZZZ